MRYLQSTFIIILSKIDHTKAFKVEEKRAKNMTRLTIKVELFTKNRLPSVLFIMVNYQDRGGWRQKDE